MSRSYLLSLSLSLSLSTIPKNFPAYCAKNPSQLRVQEKVVLDLLHFGISWKKWVVLGENRESFNIDFVQTYICHRQWKNQAESKRSQRQIDKESRFSARRTHEFNKTIYL